MSGRLRVLERREPAAPAREQRNRKQDRERV
jgi:hypothetical protein